MKAGLWVVAICIVFAGAVSGVYLSFKPQAPSQPITTSSTEKTSICAVGTPVTGRVLVGANRIPVMKGPGQNAGLVIIESVSEVTHHPEYSEVSG